MTAGLPGCPPAMKTGILEKRRQFDHLGMTHHAFGFRRIGHGRLFFLFQKKKENISSQSSFKTQQQVILHRGRIIFHWGVNTDIQQRQDRERE